MLIMIIRGQVASQRVTIVVEVFTICMHHQSVESGKKVKWAITERTSPSTKITSLTSKGRTICKETTIPELARWEWVDTAGERDRAAFQARERNKDCHLGSRPRAEHHRVLLVIWAMRDANILQAVKSHQLKTEYTITRVEWQPASTKTCLSMTINPSSWSRISMTDSFKKKPYLTRAAVTLITRAIIAAIFKWDKDWGWTREL